MKTILIPTDFSENAAHAAAYGYKLAKQIKNNVILCNAFVVPVEMPEAGMVAWPMYEYDEIAESCANGVKALKEDLEKTNLHGFRPVVKCINEVGSLQGVVGELIAKHHIGLIVMGTHGASGISGFMLGNHSRRMIDDSSKPLLLVPPKAPIVSIKKIAFATDLENIGKDLAAIFELVNLAKPLNAEILLTYVDDKKYHTEAFKKQMDEILTNLSSKTDYPFIYYRLIKSHSTNSGLDWLCHHGQIDMLAMVHRRHNFLDAVINGSHTQKIAGHITKPLLVFPAQE
jgi:nucleotide-binding universal stress UspA family protein